jgi:XTP/dITP diphosphohydrolase
VSPHSQHRLLYLATANPHKAAEILEMLAGCGWQVLPAPAEVADVEETGQTFEENARLKAQTVARVTGACALADDSGLEVDALEGAPGPMSRRWAGAGANDADRNRLLLDALHAVPPERRTARFVCVACIASPQGILWEGRGSLEGSIAMAPSGEGGFGYDPLFTLPQDGRTLAELTRTEKNAVSHRGRAIAAARAWLREHNVEDTTCG